MGGENHHHHHQQQHVQGAPTRTWLLPLLTLLVMVSATQEVRQEDESTVADFSEDQVKAMFVPKSRQKRFIYPGTMWCGDGTNAKNYTDLGRLKELDMCCRDHDNCNDSIRANNSKHGLHNPLTHTSSHCDCDATFRQCVNRTKGFDPGFVGGIYFAIAVCFKYSHPSHCVTRSESGERCLRYKYDKKSAKTWQFFDTLPWNYVEPTTVAPTTARYTTATEGPPSPAQTSRAASITVGSTVTVITVAIVVTVLLYNKMKDTNICCPCKKNRKYKMVSTVEDFL